MFLEQLSRSNTPQLKRADELTTTPPLDKKPLPPSESAQDMVKSPSGLMGGAEHHGSKSSLVEDVYVAKYDYEGTEDTEELTFREGDHITVVRREESGWWQGLVNDHYGWFPATYVEPLTIGPTDVASNNADMENKDTLEEPRDLGPRKMTEVTAGTSEEVEATGYHHTYTYIKYIIYSIYMYQHLL